MKLGRFSALTALILLYCSAALALGQHPSAEFLNRVHTSVRVAADAAHLILTTEPHRREADRLLASGQIDEARARLRLAEEIIDSAVSNEESL